MFKGHAASHTAQVKGFVAGEGGGGGGVSRQECLRDLAGIFEQMRNAERQLQELPLVLARQGEMGRLLELVTSQQALRYVCVCV